MGHHLTPDGKFKSDKFPDLPEDYVAIKVSSPKARAGLQYIVRDYMLDDPEFAEDLLTAVLNAGRNGGARR